MGHEIEKVYTAEGMIEAEIVRGLLEAAGIGVWLSHESAATAYGLGFGPMALVEVFVQAGDLEAAREALRDYNQGPADDSDATSAYG